MAIDVLTMCRWDGCARSDTEIQAPDWPSVEKAIRELNNQNRNDVYLIPNSHDRETYLAVGGGAGRYLVTGSVQSERFPTLIHPKKPPTPKELLVVGGQEGDYPGNWIVDLEMALQAARVFYESGNFGDGMNWQEV
jgi:hypothetical protein